MAKKYVYFVSYNFTKISKFLRIRTLGYGSASFILSFKIENYEQIKRLRDKLGDHRKKYIINNFILLREEETE